MVYLGANYASGRKENSFFVSMPDKKESRNSYKLKKPMVKYSYDISKETGKLTRTRLY